MKTVVQWYKEYHAFHPNEIVDVDALLAEAESLGYAVATVSKSNATKALIHAVTTMNSATDFVHGPRSNCFLFNSDEEAIMFKLTFA